MCGIAGSIGFDKSITEKMLEKLKHRGRVIAPVYEKNGVCMGHTRLEIVGGESNTQPIVIGNYSITFNGEIYNYLDLRIDLMNHGVKFKTKGDAEVILCCYILYGLSFINHIKGIFAFAIYDDQKKQLILCRDRVGVKPLYYTTDFRFASEIKVFGYKKINLHAFCEYLVFQYCLNNKTMFENVFKVLPGEMVIIKDKHIERKKYWQLDNICIQGTYERYYTEEFYKDKLLALLHISVKRQTPTVPFGAYASGGLDSSIVATLLSEYSKDFALFSGRYVEKGYDESEYAQKLSKTLSNKLNLVTITEQDVIDNLSNAIYYLDEPCAGPGLIGQYILAKTVREQTNIKVMFGGQGGDELFGGYSRYIIAYLESCLHGAIYQKQGNYILTLNDLSPLLPVLQGYEPMLKKFLSSGVFDDKDKRYFDLIIRNTHIGEDFKSEYNKYLCPILDEFRQIFSELGDVSYFTKMTYFDFVASLPALLQVDDRVNGAFELESRVPLLDEDIIEFAFSVPPKYKFSGGSAKGLLRQATLGMLPQEITNRKDKMGFPVPFDKWFKDKMNPIRFFILDHIGKSDIVAKVFGKSTIEGFDRDTWGKLSLALWEDRFGAYL